MTKELTYNLPHSTQFAQKWEEWIKYRTELKKPYKTQKGITMALSKLGTMTEIDAISMIDHSMSNEYQGLYGDGKKKEKGEVDKTYTEPKKPTFSNYQAKTFDHQNHRHMRDTLRKNYEKGTFITDTGDLYTQTLHPSIPKEVEADMLMKEEKEEGRKRNRFEPQYRGNVKFNVRDKVLNYWLDEQRKQGIKIYETI